VEAALPTRRRVELMRRPSPSAASMKSSLSIWYRAPLKSKVQKTLEFYIDLVSIDLEETIRYGDMLTLQKPRNKDLTA
jgi:hypothetical protein